MEQNYRVREIRKSLGLTMEEFGKRLGVTRTAISNIESGNRNLTEQMRKLICKEFYVNETWFITGEGEMFGSETKQQRIAEIVSRLVSVDEPVKLSLISLLSTASESQLRAAVLRIYEELKKNGFSFDDE